MAGFSKGFTQEKLACARTANVRSWSTFADRLSAYLVEHQRISLHEADSNVSA
jgi:hypothetical protein